MEIINFQDANCLHCYKCLRFCEVKAIRIDNQQAKIMSDYCVLCGKCLEVCPQNAKTFASDLDDVKQMISKGEKIVVSLAPAYRGILKQEKSGQVIDALLKLGFYQVRETAEGASYITDEYVRLLEEGQMDNIITTSCPSANALIEKYYPNIIPYMAPVVSPMIAHGKLIKNLLGSDVKVVFLGPCISKKEEAKYDERTKGIIDAVINFTELEQWMHEVSLRFEDCDDLSFANPDPKVNQLYPVSGGTIRSVMRRGMNEKYQKISVTGIKSCREVFHSMKMGRIHNCFVEVMICKDGCVNGPIIEKNRGFRFKATLDIEANALNVAPDYPPLPKEISLTKNFTPNVHKDKIPSETELAKILESIGHYKISSEFNCGACGYFTCRDKAIAIYQGKADPEMCLLNSYEKAKSMANVVMESTPNIIFIINSEMKIIEFNPKAEEYFKISRTKALETYLFELINPTDFEQVLLTKEAILRKKTKLPEFELTILETIVPVDGQESVLAILQDISAEERELEVLYDKRLETVKMAQEVIEKQMTTAQEIAGLLGETTAETKAILTKVRNMMLTDEGV